MIFILIAVYCILAGLGIFGIFFGFTDIHFHRRRKEGCIRVACVGDSVTNGCWLPNCFTKSYPSVLQRLLGPGYQVENYGLNDRTVAKSDDVSYMREPENVRSRLLKPDIVVILLGSNDSRTKNWTDRETFHKAYGLLADRYLNLPYKPRVLICTPPREYQYGRRERFKIIPENLEIVAEEIRKTAAEKNLELVELYDRFEGLNKYFAVDGIHPDKRGAILIAETVAGQIAGGKRTERNMDIPEINEENIELLEDRKFLKLYAYHYAGGDYVVASRHDREGLAVLHQDSDFPDAVSCIVIFTDEKGEGRLYLQKEFRYPLGRFVLSPPAGLIDPEDGKNADAVLTAAKREIFEETGLELTENDRAFTVLPGAFSSAGMTDESNAFVCAVTEKADLSGMNQEGGVGGECFDGFRLYTEEEARALLKEGRDETGSICPAQTWLAVLYFISGLWKE